MSDFIQDITGAVNNRKRGEDIADAIGMPDQQDYEVLLSLFQKFEKLHPGLIHATAENGRKEYHEGIHARKRVFDSAGRAVINKENNMVYAFELPGDLYTAIEKIFPSMFRSRKHFAWFKRNFSKLLIGEG